MATRSVPTRTTAEALLALLKARGVDHLIANAGTDFAPVIEALARAPEAGLDLPTPVLAAHETLAVGMAHGFYLATGRPQAVMAHVNVGSANALMGLINAARDNVPILFASGRTPVTEGPELTGSRDLPIHWGQEMFDQAGMLREAVKWEYELRVPEQVEIVVDRALAVAMTPPRGPVYLSLPREALARPLDGFTFAEPAALPAATAAAPAPAAIAETARILARAERPVVIAARGGAWSFEALADLAERFGIPTVEFWPTRISMASDHPLHGGFDPAPWLADADAVVVLDALVPWLPKRFAPAPDVPVVQIGPDPLFFDLPIRGFRATLAIQSDPALAVAALAEALTRESAGSEAAITARREAATRRAADLRRARHAAADAGRTRPMTQGWICRCLDAAKGDDAVVVNELGSDPGAMTFRRPGTFFGPALSAGLGWGLPAALGFQLADRDRTVIATVGDGSYMFANPVACHQAGEALGLPVLTIVFNNGVWNAVQRTTRMVYPDGHAVRANAMPLVSLEPAPRYAQVVEASGGWGERVEDPDALPGAIERALRVVREEKRQALLDVVCAP